MARSVDYLRDSIGLAFIPTHEFLGVDELGEDTSFEWDWAIESLQESLAHFWPSLEAEDGWQGREVSIVAGNSHAVVGVSSYCGLTSISIAVRGDAEHPELAENWVRRISGKFEEKFGNLRRIGRFSNGECVYERVAS
jgi:hypothetical protein